MYHCSICPRLLDEAKICKKCGSCFCKNESCCKCPLCKGEFINVKLSQEKLHNKIITWINSGSQSLGICDFENIPKLVATMLSSEELDTSFKFILFPTKSSSIEFARACYKSITNKEYIGDEVVSKSRYTIIGNLRKKTFYILINCEATKIDESQFLIKFLKKAAEIRSKINEPQSNVIRESIAKFIFGYNKKLGIPFAKLDDETSHMVYVAECNAINSFAETRALKPVLSDNTINLVAEMLKYKISEVSLWRDPPITYITQVYDVLQDAIRLKILASVGAENSTLKKFFDQIISDERNKVQKKYSKIPDVLSAVELIFDKFDPSPNVSFSEHCREIARIYEKAFEKIFPHYLRFAEVPILFSIGRDYMESLSKGVALVLPNIGTLEHFKQILKTAFNKTDNPFILRLVVGETLMGIYQDLMLMQDDISAYYQALDLVWPLTELLEESVLKTKELFGDTYENKESLGYHDVALVPLALSQFSVVFGDTESYNSLTGFAAKIAKTHNEVSTLIAILWRGFLQTHDYSKLKEIYRISSTVSDSAKHEYISDYHEPITNIVRGIIENDNSFIDKALELASSIGITDRPIGLISTLQGLRSGQAYCFFIELFSQMNRIKISSFGEDFRKAMKYAKIVTEYISDVDPMNTFVTKTELLDAVINSRENLMKNLSEKFLKQTNNSSQAKQFVDCCTKWLTTAKEKRGRTFIEWPAFDFDEIDPWNRVLKLHIFSKMKRDLEDNVIGKEVIVFVEGETDAIAFEEFTSKVAPERRIRFLDTRGYTNMNFFAEAQLSKEIKIPVHIIFDGDTLIEQNKRELREGVLSKMMLSNSRIHTLKEYCIESYLLNPEAIKAAFPENHLSLKEIQNFIDAQKTNPNKKRVMEGLFNKYINTSYKSEVAKRIAEKIPPKNISDEIIQLIKNLK
jgi:hypothetical protein